MLQMEQSQSRAAVTSTGIKWGALVLIFFFGYLAVAKLAGLNTNANFNANADVKLAADVNLGGKDPATDAGPWVAALASNRTVAGLAMAVAVFATYLAGRWKRQHRDTIEQLGKLRRGLEKTIDPDRSSSGLEPRGDTRKEDRR